MDGLDGTANVVVRDLTPEEREAMERATLRLQEELRELLASRPRRWTPLVDGDVAGQAGAAQ